MTVIRIGVAILGTMSFILGCGSDTTGPSAISTGDAYWALRLNYHAVNLALTPTDDTVQLTAIPYTAAGDSLLGADPVTFVSADSTVSVSTTGLVKANYTTKNAQSPTYVVAKLQYKGVTLTDTVYIQVTQTAPSPAYTAISVQPKVGITTTCNIPGYGGTYQVNCGPFVVNGIEATGDTVKDIAANKMLIAFATSNALIASISSLGVMTPRDTGHITIMASTWAYGATLQDSIRYTVSWPLLQVVNIVSVTPVGSLTPVLTFDRPVVSVNVGGSVAWVNASPQKIDIVFDDSTDVQQGCVSIIAGICFWPYTGAGNIPPFYTDASGTDPSVFAGGRVVRSFPVVGIYHIHSRLFPSTKGIVYVHPSILP
jgi:hypothetical protein